MKNKNRLILAGVISLLLGGVVLADEVNLKNENNSSLYDTKEPYLLREALNVELKKAKEMGGDFDAVEYLSSIYWNIGNSYLYRYEDDKAIKAYQKAIEIKPTNDRAYSTLGIVYSRQQKYNKAIDFFTKAIEINPKEAGHYSNIGTAYIEKKEYDKAINFYKKAIEINPKEDTYYFNMGVWYSKQKEYAKAIAIYKKIIKLNPQDSEAYINLFEIQLTQNRPFSAELEKKYKEIFEDKKETLIQYDLLKILQNISQNRKVDLDKWQEKYHEIGLENWGFNSLDEWSSHIDNNKTKKELQKAIELFKKHQADLVYTVYDDSNTTYNEPKVVDEKLEDEKILIYNLITSTPILEDINGSVSLNKKSYLRYMDDKLKKDKEFLLECDRLGADIFVFMDESLKKDREFVVSLMKQNDTNIDICFDSNCTSIKSYEPKRHILENLDESLRNDKEFVFKTIWNSNASLFEFIGETLRKDKEFTLEALKLSSSSDFIYIDKSLREDKSFILEMLKEGLFIFDYIDEKFKKDRDVALAVIRQHPFFDSYVDDGKKPSLNLMDGDLAIFYESKYNIFKNDRAFIIELLKHNPFFMKKIEPNFKKDKEFLLTALKESDSHFKAPKVSSPFITMIDESLKKDKEFITRVLKIEPRLLKYIDESFQKDKDFLIQTEILLYKNRETVLKLIRDKKARAEGIADYSEEDGFRLDSINEIYRSDREIVLEAVKHKAWNIHYADAKLKKDKEILEIAICGGAGLEFADTKMAQNRELILEYVKNGGYDLENIDPKLKKDKSFALEVVKKSGDLLKYFDNKLKIDREVVISAIKNDGYSLEYADKSLKQDEEILLMALQKSGYGLQYASEELRDNRELALEILKKNWKAHQYLSYRLKKDRGVILTAMRHFWGCGEGNRLYDIDNSLKQDRVFISKFLDIAPFQIESIDEKFKKDRDLVESIIKKYPRIMNFYTMNDAKLSELIKQDNKFVLSMIKKSGYGLFLATKEQKADRELVLRAISLNTGAFGYADKSLRRDKKFVLKIAQLTKNDKNGFWQSGIDTNLIKDRDFVIEMLKINPKIFSNIDEDLKNDKQFILEILKNRDIDNNEIDIDYELFKDKSFVAEVVRLTGRGLQYATTKQQDNRTLVLEAIKHNVKATYFMSDRLQEDKEVLETIEEIKNPLWKKIFTPLNIILVFLFGYWWRESKKKR